MYNRRPLSNHPILVTVVIAMSIFSGFVSATENTPDEETTVQFDQTYFSQFQVVTLTDMIRLVPGGVSLLNGLNRFQQSRGLGANGAQILIDGKRMSGKANDMSTRLRRIQASQVERIELLRGTAEGLDIRSQGILINVVLKSTAMSEQTYLTELRVMHNTQQQLVPEFLISTTGQSGKMEYDFSYNYDVFTRVYDEVEDRMDASRNLQEIRYLNVEFIRKEHNLTGNIQYNFDNGDVFRLNGLYLDEHRDDDSLEEQISYLNGDLLAIEELLIDRDERGWEIGADYEAELADWGNLKVLFINTETNNKQLIKQIEFANDVSERLFDFAEDNDESERIVRVNVSREVFGDQTLEYGGELALNELAAQQSFNLAEFEASTINENRYELFVTHSMSLNQNMNLQTALTREESTIKQDALGLKNERNFAFWKPRLEFRYDFDSARQLRMVADRSVSQLNLRNFIARRNTEDDTIDSGNPDLVPEKTWRYLVSYEHRFADDSGSVEVELFKDEISDFISKARLADGSTGIGNVGDASIVGFNFEANGKLDALGLDNALLSFTYRHRDTKMRDPFTDSERVQNSTPEHYYLIDYRHDLTDLGLVYGFNAHKRSMMFRQDRTLYEIRTNSIHISELFVEYNIDASMKLRFEVRNPLKDKKRYDKTFYDDDIALGMINRVDYRRSDVRPTYAIKLQATF